MDPAAQFGRGRQAFLKWMDRLASPWRRETLAWRPFHELKKGPVLTDMEGFLRVEDYWGAAATLRRHFSSHLPERFFPGPFDAAVPLRFGSRLPDERSRLLAQADAICDGRFDLLGYQGLSFGDPVDWHLDPVARRRVPLVHWSRIDPHDVAMCGDCRVIWQLNRHQWLVCLGQAYRLTGASRYAERFDETIRDWIRVNPVGLGINWTSSQEVAHRLLAWCWALPLFWPSAALTADLLTLIVDEIRLHATHIERYVSHEDPPNWPLTVQGLALFYVGCLFPELRRAEPWRRKGLRIMSQQILREVGPDGRSRSDSTAHHRRVIEAYLHFLVLAERNAVPVSPAVRERVEALLKTLLPLRRPDGRMMQIGEAEGDSLLPLLPRDRDDWRGLFAVAAVLFASGQYAWAAGGFFGEVFWFFGEAGEEAFEHLTPVPPEEALSSAALRGGFVQMRSGWERRSHQLVFDVGSIAGRSGPGSRDLLSIQCAAFGEPIVVDPDLSGTAGHREWQEFIQKTSTHSILLVDGLAPGAAADDRLSVGRPRAVLRQWSRNERFELADAQHDGYRSLPNPVVHRRRVLFVKRAYWVLIDDLQGVGRHRVDLVFQLTAHHAQLDPTLWAKVWASNGPGLAIKPFASGALRGEIRDGATDSTPRTLVYHAEAEVPIRLVTLLFPLRDEQASIPRVTPFLDQQGRLSGLTVDDPPATILYSDQSVTVEAA